MKKLKQPTCFHVEGKPEYKKAIIELVKLWGFEASEGAYDSSKYIGLNNRYTTAQSLEKIEFQHSGVKYKLIENPFDNPNIWEEEKGMTFKDGCGLEYRVSEWLLEKDKMTVISDNGITRIKKTVFKDLAELAGYKVFESDEEIESYVKELRLEAQAYDEYSQEDDPYNAKGLLKELLNLLK